MKQKIRERVFKKIPTADTGTSTAWWAFRWNMERHGSCHAGNKPLTEYTPSPLAIQQGHAASTRANEKDKKSFVLSPKRWILSYMFFLILLGYHLTYNPRIIPRCDSSYGYWRSRKMSYERSIFATMHISSIYLSIHLSIYPSIHPSIYLSIHPSIHPSIDR